jgi:UDP-glucose 4-epimerase
MKRIVITGSSGYLGGCLLRYLLQKYPTAEILGIDIVPPKNSAGYAFLQMDMCDPGLTEKIVAFAPDTLIHHGFVVPPMHNEKKMRQINVEGSRNVLQAAAACKVQRLCVASSATAFGGWPDNPVPIDDRHPVRARPEFRYASDKVELENLLTTFVAEHPEITVSWIRPCIVAGPNMRNYLQRLIFSCPWLAILDGVDTPLQLVHEDDVTAATHEILVRNATGPFNIAPVDAITQEEMATATKRILFRLPLGVAKVLSWLAWWSYFPTHEYPPGLLYFIRYPWIAAPNRLIHELGYEFQYTTRTTFDQMLELRRNRKR